MKHGSVFLILLLLVFVSCTSPQQQATQPTPSPEPSPELSGTYIFQRRPDNGSSPKAPQSGDIKIVEGNISGLIVQKGPVKQGPSEKDPTKTLYTGSYSLINGGEISAIDKDGVHKDGRTLLLVSISQPDTPFDDTEVLQIAMDMPEGAFFGSFTKAGGTVIRIGGTGKQTASTDALLGEFRVDPETKKGRIIPAVEIKSDAGPITIPVKNFVAFKEKPNPEEKKP